MIFVIDVAIVIATLMAGFMRERAGRAVIDV